MNKQEKILELLEKEDLTDSEKQELDSLIQNDEELKKIFRSYKTLSKVVKISAHLSYEELSDYILYKNGYEPEDNSIIKRIPFIENHLRECKKCSDEFLQLSEELTNIDNFMTSEFGKEKEGKQIVQNNIFQRGFTGVYRYAVAAVVALILIYSGLYLASSFTKPVNYDVASLTEDESDFYITRGRASEEFQNGINAIEEGNYDKAIESLKKDIANNENESTIFYSHYILGLTYLESAESDFIGLFPTYNPEKVKKGIEQLSKSIKENDTGKFPNITLDARYYLAKGYLMQNNLVEAKKQLHIVIDEKGGKMNEAKQILNDLE